jgi:predicted DNA-binding protein (UPF0251 family)
MFINFMAKWTLMARHKKDRLIQMAPNFSGFQPQGVQSKSVSEVSISFEEYEALNLCDYELMNQSEAAKMMKVSRPTFTRIYESVRRKIAQAFIEGSCIHFENGNSIMSGWYKCPNCQINFTLLENTNICCPVCKSHVLTENP